MSILVRDLDGQLQGAILLSIEVEKAGDAETAPQGPRPVVRRGDPVELEFHSVTPKSGFALFHLHAIGGQKPGA